MAVHISEHTINISRRSRFANYTRKPTPTLCGAENTARDSTINNARAAIAHAARGVRTAADLVGELCPTCRAVMESTNAQD